MDDKIKTFQEQIADVKVKYVADNPDEIPPLNKQKEMVACALLIETMEDQGATSEELINALTYCGIVIDADKMKLNWRKAYDDLGIDALCEKYINIEEKETNENN